MDEKLRAVDRGACLQEAEPLPLEMAIYARVVGERIRGGREACGFSESTVAERAGVPAFHVAQIERGEADPTLDTLCAIASAINLPITSILSGRP